MEIENIWWKKWLLIFYICVFENRYWFVSILTNHPTDRKYQFDVTPDGICISPNLCSFWAYLLMGVYLGKNNLLIYISFDISRILIYFSQYIRQVNIPSVIYQLSDTSIYLFRFGIPSGKLMKYIKVSQDWI